MALVRMALGSYRGFAKTQTIELRPITIVLGRNNAGKSALVRAPVIFGTGILTASPEPLDLDQLSEEMLDSFTDLSHGSRTPARVEVDLGVRNADGLFRVVATIYHVDEHHTQVVESMELLKNGSQICRMEWELNDPPTNPNLYTVQVGDRRWLSVPVPFRGLLPVRPVVGHLPDDLCDAIESAATAIDLTYPTVRYLGPFRDRPQRRFRLPGRMPAEVGVAGQYAAGILASDKARSGGRILDQVNADLAEHLPGWRVGVAERGGMWSVVLESIADDAVQVNLADTGTGVAQALPIFVQRAVDLINPSGRPVLEIVEQPELHLHPAAHAMLADLYLDAVRRTSTRFLIETHSETLLLRLRRRIAQGLDPSTVAVYFVDNGVAGSVARRIHIDADGNLDYWPAGVFAEDYHEVRELAKVQREKRTADAR